MNSKVTMVRQFESRTFIQIMCLLIMSWALFFYFLNKKQIIYFYVILYISSRIIVSTYCLILFIKYIKLKYVFKYIVFYWQYLCFFYINHFQKNMFPNNFSKFEFMQMCICFARAVLLLLFISDSGLVLATCFEIRVLRYLPV